MKRVLFMFLFGISLYSQVPLIPRAVLFGNPTKSSVQLSPQGTYVSYCAPYNGIMNIHIQRRNGFKGFDEPCVITKESAAIQSYFWSFDEKKIFFLRDTDGDENTQLFAIDLATNVVQRLTPQGVKARVSYYDEKYPDMMLIAMNAEDPAVFDIYELSLSTLQIVRKEQSPKNGIGWIIDHDAQIRFVYATTHTGGKQLLMRKKGAWVPWIVWSNDDAWSVSPWFFSDDNRYLYCADPRDADVASLVKIDCETGKSTVIAYDPGADVAGCFVQPRTRAIQGVWWTKARDEVHFFDAAFKKIYEYVAARESGDCSIISRTLDDAHWIVAFEKDIAPVSYYYVNTKNKTMHFLGHHRSEIRDYTLTDIEPLSFKARDGLTIHGYVSYPQDIQRSNLPCVVYVHGGPWVRDTWGFNPMVQWFTNRGYVCLQVNYRGSTGYGKQFINAGNKQWSRAMHTDLLDGISLLVAQGVIDPKKIAIYGGSYGGYAALVGATHTPDVFCCAIDIVGPSNLLTFIRSIPPYWKVFLEDMYRRVGNPDTEEAFLKSCSPLFAIDNIKIPLFIAQGANDPRVKQAESEQIVAALTEKNIPHTYMLFTDEGHGFSKPVNRLAFMAAAEKFLSENLGGRCEA